MQDFSIQLEIPSMMDQKQLAHFWKAHLITWYLRSVTSWYIIRKGAFIHVDTTTWHYKIVEQFKGAFSYEISFFVQVKDNFQCTHQTKRRVFVCHIFNHLIFQNNVVCIFNGFIITKDIFKSIVNIRK